MRKPDTCSAQLERYICLGLLDVVSESTVAFLTVEGRRKHPLGHGECLPCPSLRSAGLPACGLCMRYPRQKIPKRHCRRASGYVPALAHSRKETPVGGTGRFDGAEQLGRRAARKVDVPRSRRGRP